MLARPASILQEYGPMMRDLEAWQYDEFRQMGRDYGNPAEVEIYDSIHAGFRDVEAESNQVLDLLVLASSDVGSGTGTFAVAAARRCARVHAVEVSPAIIEYAKTKAIRAGVLNIIFSHAGFLTYEHLDQPAAAIATTFALHHLPDLWKGIALARMRSILKPGISFISTTSFSSRTMPWKTSRPLSISNQSRGRFPQERCGRPFSARTFNL
jgi:SAM-dependent methyltransferase